MSARACPVRQTRRLPAFTLVELLVVIAIIALLIALLFPTINRAQQSAYQVKCAAQISQILSTVHVHANAHQGYAPLVGILSVASVDPTGLQDKSRVRYNYLSFSVAAENNIVEAFTASLSSEMGDPRIDQATNVNQLDATNMDPNSYMRIFRCPSDMLEPGPVHEYATYCIDPLTAGSYPGIRWSDSQSYIYNEAVLGWNDSLARGRGKIASVRDQSRTMLMADGVGGPETRMSLDFTTIYNKVSATPVSVADALAGNGKAGDPSNFDPVRHRGHINIGFFDGHVETRNLDTNDLSSVYLIAP